MGDFHQNGIITTLHNLASRPLVEMEKELCTFSKQRPMGLILPSLFSEIEGEALPNIIEHLKGASYLSQIVIGLDRADQAQYQHALSFFGKLPQEHRVLWNDGPRLQALDAELKLICAIEIPTLLADLDLIDPIAYVTEAKDEMVPALKQLAAANDLPTSVFKVKRGPVEKVITSYAAKQRAQLVVMGTVGRSGVRARLLGNTAEAVLQHLKTDVLALKLEN